MKTFTTYFLAFFILLSSSFSALAINNNIQAQPGQFNAENEIAKNDVEPRLNPLSKQYRKSVRQEKRYQRNMFKKAKRKMMRKLLGKKWKQLWTKQF